MLLVWIFIAFTLEPPQLQHHRAALQVVQQAPAGVQGGKVYSVIQHWVDIVPHSRTEQIATAVKQSKPERGEERKRRNDPEGSEYSLHIRSCQRDISNDHAKGIF